MEKLIFKHETYARTLHALHRAIKNLSRTDIDADLQADLIASVIKHFEMCYEASWKFLKLYLEVHYSHIANSPREVFRQCFIFCIFDEQTTQEFLKICDARNTTTHTYDEEKAQEICQRIYEYAQAFKKIDNISVSTEC
jgi:nucleotidyltransferase substrate binding protein (TIGR01987 family)